MTATGGPRRVVTGRAAAQLRACAPALLGYLAVRAVGVLILLVNQHSVPVLTRLGTLWDAHWYTDVATHGYRDDIGVYGVNGVPFSTRAFFPLYPLLIRAVTGVLPVSAPGAALAVAWAASLVAALGIFAVVAHRYNRRVGVITVVLWGALPHAAVQSMAYSESLFTALAAWSLHALQRRNWIRAGVLSLLAGLVRPTAAAVVAAVCLAAAVELVRRVRRREAEHGDAPAWWRIVLGAGLAPLGIVGYIGYVDHVRRSWSGYSYIQSAWGTQFDGGMGTARWLDQMFLSPGSPPQLLNQVVIALVVVAYVVLFLLALVQRQPLPWLVYGATILAVAIGSSSTDAARARFLVPAFVLLVPLAAGLSRVRSRASLGVLLGSAAVCSGFYGVYLVFANSYSP
ncbi:hypothetical protein [Kitasatospora sp. NBC_01302]|uniref:hypothetical protein n=1 Tax=Kitasatospora sp. NBC_01302 TaxID=2903575 RepID=UPI002E13B586|nr:hypothetical protein OG294_16830 [Kitasatospora sp. NBC_01302]